MTITPPATPAGAHDTPDTSASAATALNGRAGGGAAGHGVAAGTGAHPDGAGSRTGARRITGLKPTGHLHLGSLFGAIQPMREAQYRTESMVFVADLHALTVEHDPTQVRTLTLELAGLLLAAGIDPDRTICYTQSHLPEHSELHYLLECATGYGEAHRMIQFRERATGQRDHRLSLLSYPVLMAADILLHDTEEVPVGVDQAQHLELTREVARRFNARYGPTFTVPRAVCPQVAARVRDLTDPTAKMGKSRGATAAGTLFLLDDADTVRRKILRAVTDGGTTVEFDPQHRPGVANLLEITAACRGADPAALAGEFRSYRQLKEATVEAVCAVLHPIQQRYAELSRDPGHLRRVLADGAQRARQTAVDTVHRARSAFGLLPTG